MVIGSRGIVSVQHAGFMTSSAEEFPTPKPNDASLPHNEIPSHLFGLGRDDLAHSAELQSGRVQITRPEEILSYIQCTLGFSPTESLVVVAFAQYHLSSVIRCDLPKGLRKILQSDTLESVTFLDFGLTETQELQLVELGKQLGRLIAREPSTTSCLLIYLPRQVSVSDHYALAATGAINAMILDQLRIQHVVVEESWLIQRRLLWHLQCAATTDCETQGLRLGNPENTRVFQALDPQGRTRQQSQTTVPMLIYPQPTQDPPKQPPNTQSLLEHRPQVVLNWLQSWDDRLSRDPSMLDSQQVTDLLSAFEHPTLCEAVVGIACFDYATAIRGMLSLRKFPSHIARLAGQRGNTQDGRALQDCWHGGSNRKPDWQRIAALERLSRQLLPLSDANSGGALAGVIVWIEWVRGRGSIGLHYLQQARRHFPAEPSLEVLENILRNGTVAGWATRPDMAWMPGHAA